MISSCVGVSFRGSRIWWWRVAFFGGGGGVRGSVMVVLERGRMTDYF